MEAAEFAMRLARAATGRPGVIGFAGAMHGKSLGTALLGWDNTGAPDVPFLHRLPFVPHCSVEQTLADAERTLSGHAISAVFLEPIQASSGGHAIPAAFCQSLQRLCRRHDALLVFDEVLTGFHRTGPPFLFAALGLDSPPDMVLAGKAMAGGFPASAVVTRRDVPITPAALPGSTFAGNALAAAAISATLSCMRALDLPAMVLRIEQVVHNALRDLPEGMNLRGRGALWVLELAPTIASRVPRIIANCYNRGVFVSHTSRFIRLLPAATIELEHLAEACAVLREELLR
jgi:acetylornithine/succinyldiaminopimelate/putrescine aminotransferase